ncbi:MAG: universal stress protein [Nitrososphaerales archaeon]
MRIVPISIYSQKLKAIMKQILVAVDEHAHAEKIVESAIELAQGISAKIILMYVVEGAPPENYRDTHGDALPEHYYEDEFARSVGPLVEVVEKAGLTCEPLAGSGDPVKEILRAATSRGVNYIVMGTRELRGLDRLRAIGSVSRNVIEKSTIPVVAVP